MGVRRGHVTFRDFGHDPENRIVRTRGGPEWLIRVPCAGALACGGAGQPSGADRRAWFVFYDIYIIGSRLQPGSTHYSKHVSRDGHTQMCSPERDLLNAL